LQAIACKGFRYWVLSDYCKTRGVWPNKKGLPLPQTNLTGGRCFGNPGTTGVPGAPPDILSTTFAGSWAVPVNNRLQPFRRPGNGRMPDDLDDF